MQYEDGNISPLKAFFRKKWVILFLIIDVVIIIAIIVALIIKASRVSTINFDITPLDATISVNGDTNYSNGVYSVSPGTYQITISHSGLETKTFSIEIEPHHVATITTFLAGENNNLEFYELKDNYASLQKLIEIASAGNNITTDHDTSAESFIKQFNKKYAVFDKFPIVDRTSTGCGQACGTRYQYDKLVIQDGKSLAECTKTLCIQITDTSGEKEDYALSVIKKFGFNPEDYQIIYQKVDYE